VVKLKVREKSISYAAKKKKKSERTKKEEELVKSIAILEKQLDNGNSSEPPSQKVIEKLNTLKRDLEKIIEYISDQRWNPSFKVSMV